MTIAVIKTHNITKKIGKTTIIRSASIEVPRGAIYTLLGPNGAGKSSLFGILLGMSRPTSGEILRAPVKPMLTGFIGSEPPLFQHLSCEENLSITQYLIGNGVCMNEIDKVLELVGLTRAKKKTVSILSTGMKQRLGLARCLLVKPEVMLLDEPSNGLDPNGIAKFRDLIKRVNSEFGTTFLISSHILSEVEKFSTHVGYMFNGVIVAQEPLATLSHISLEERYCRLAATEEENNVEI